MHQPGLDIFLYLERAIHLQGLLQITHMLLERVTLGPGQSQRHPGLGVLIIRHRLFCRLEGIGVRLRFLLLSAALAITIFFLAYLVKPVHFGKGLAYSRSFNFFLRLMGL